VLYVVRGEEVWCRFILWLSLHISGGFAKEVVRIRHCEPKVKQSTFSFSNCARKRWIATALCASQ